MRDEVKIDDGRRAEELLKNDILQRAFTEIRMDQFKAFEHSTTPESREEAFRNLKAVNFLIRKLESIRNSGVMEANKT